MAPAHRDLHDLCVAVVSDSDPEDPRSHSGGPASLLEALQALGPSVVPVRAAPDPRLGRVAVLGLTAARLRPRDLRAPRAGLRRRRPGATVGPTMARLRSLAAARQLRAAPRLDAVVQHGCEYRLALPANTPLATYEDSTYLQARSAYPWPWLREQSERDVRRFVARQRVIYQEARACCTYQHWAARSIVEDYGIPEEKVFVVGLGSNVPPTRGERDWSSPRYLFVGVDWERKNGPEVLRAFRAVRERVPEATLDIAGGHPRLDQEGVVGHGMLRADVAEDQARLAELFARATCFVMPSHHEPTGTVHAEAAAAGVASIASASGGASTIVADAGRVVSPDDHEAILGAMLDFADAATAKALGARARERAKLFTWHAVAERILRALALPGVRTDGFAEPL